MASSSSSSGKQGQAKITEHKGLPDSYGDTKIVLLPRDPHWAFAYWEIKDDVKSELTKKYGSNAKMVLRVYDVTGIDFNGLNANKYFDIELNPFANNWYLNVPEVNRSWCVDLGLALPDGTFILIARSNILHMPRFGVSPIVDEKWGILQKDFEQLIEASGIDKIGKSSFGVQKMMMERWQEIISVSSGQMPSSPSRKGAAVKQEKLKDFWLEAQAELIVYGKTEPSAKVTVNNENIKLDSDGHFKMKFFLGDGTKQIPIKAVSQDKALSKTIEFTVSKNTKKD